MVKVLDYHMAECGLHLRPGGLKITPGGPAGGVMTMSLDSHVVDCSSSPRPSGLNSCQARVRACPRSLEENGGEGIVAWPSPLGGDFLLSVSLSLSVFLVSARTL